jgi:type I phosphodiesterase/nucleotide pyrophosphatase
MARIDHRIARGAALVLAVAVAWAAESYESALNVARPAVLGVSARSAPPPDRARSRVIWILVDGLRLDASRRMPFLNRLRREGLDVVARADFPTFSGPSFVTQASGIEPAASGVLSNGFPTQVQLDSVFHRGKLAGLRTAVVTTDHDDGLRRVYPRWIDESRVGDALERVPDADLLLVHIGHPDEAAHDHGTRSPAYRAAVAAADDFLARIVSTADPARDAIVVSSDHGNIAEGGHGGTEPEVVKIPLVVWGAGVSPGQRAVGRARDVGPTIASLLGVGPLCHATGRPLIGGDADAARQRDAVCAVVGAAGRRRMGRVPTTILFAVAVLMLLVRRARIGTRALAAAPTYALVFATLLVATHTLSFSVSNLTAPFALRLVALCAVAAFAQLLVGGRESVTPAAVVASVGVLAVAIVAAAQPLAPIDGTFRFLPIPALTSLAFVCLMTAVIGMPEPDTGPASVQEAGDPAEPMTALASSPDPR